MLSSSLSFGRFFENHVIKHFIPLPPWRMSFLSLQNIFIFLLHGFHAQLHLGLNLSHRLQRKKGINNLKTQTTIIVNRKTYESSVFIEISLTLLGER